MECRDLACRAGITLGGLTLVFAFQAFSGAYAGDFSSDEDEPAHVVSSLAVHDYLAAGFPHNPFAYGERYYLHYPKIAIGHWPPLFYAGEAAWMVVFGRSRVAMEAAVGLLAVALLTSVFWWVRRDSGTTAGAFAALALLAPKYVQTAIGSVSPDIALALLCFWAAVMAGRYLDRHVGRDAMLFVVLAMAAMGVHGRGAVLILIPFVLMLIGPFALTRIRAAALLVSLAILVTAPILLRQAWPLDARHVPLLAAHYLVRLGETMSWPVAALALVGAVASIRSTGEPRRWLAMPALVIGGWVFHSVVNANWADHYLISAAPAVAALSGRGLRICMDAVQSLAVRAGLAAAACAVLLWTALPLVHKRDLGYHRMTDLGGRVDLIAGSALHEGAFIAEMAMRDPGLNHFVLRGYKVLASADWQGLHYQLRYSKPEQVLVSLDQMRVDNVLVECSSSLPHVAQLLAALRSPVWREAHPRGLPQGVLAFERVVPLEPGDPVIQIDMRYRLGKILGLSPGGAQ